MRTFSRRINAAAWAALIAVIAVGAVSSSASDQSQERERKAKDRQQRQDGAPRNVILVIGDGADDSMITAARNYELGAGGRFTIDGLPKTGAMTTYGLKFGTAPDYPIAYVSDSAPTATAWSTGRKTVDGRVSQGPSESATVPGTDYETVLEKYAERGKLTGNVATSEITDATPAAAASHINSRSCHGPADMAACASARKANGGKGSIAEQLVDNEVDVLLGGGAQRYAQATDPGAEGAGRSVLEYAREELDYRPVDTEAELEGIDDLRRGPVLGLFNSGNMTPMYEPLVATPPPGSGGPTSKCEPAARGDQPTLSQMTEKAIELLDNRRGFFLQVESAMVVKQEHASDICGAIGDLAEMDRAVDAALEYQRRNRDTLVIVTGDHAHSTQIVGGPTDGKQVATLQTADGDPMSVAYSTNDSGSDHTGAQVRVAAKGPGANGVTGLIDQTDLYDVMLGR